MCLLSWILNLRFSLVDEAVSVVDVVVEEGVMVFVALWTVDNQVTPRQLYIF